MQRMQPHPLRCSIPAMYACEVPAHAIHDSRLAQRCLSCPAYISALGPVRNLASTAVDDVGRGHREGSAEPARDELQPQSAFLLAGSCIAVDVGKSTPTLERRWLAALLCDDEVVARC